MEKNIQTLLVIGLLFVLSIKLNGQDTINTEGHASLENKCLVNCAKPDYHAPIGVMIDHTHAKKEWMLSYRYMNMIMKGNIQGSEGIGSNKVYEQYLMSTESMSMQMHMLMLMYGLSDRITVMGMTSYHIKSMGMEMMMAETNPASSHEGGHGATGSNLHSSDHSENTHEMHETMHSLGFGDTKVYVLYSLIKKQNSELLLSGGINIPNGSISKSGSHNGGVPNSTLPHYMF